MVWLFLFSLGIVEARWHISSSSDWSDHTGTPRRSVTCTTWEKGLSDKWDRPVLTIFKQMNEGRIDLHVMMTSQHKSGSLDSYKNRELPAEVSLQFGNETPLVFTDWTGIVVLGVPNVEFEWVHEKYSCPDRSIPEILDKLNTYNYRTLLFQVTSPFNQRTWKVEFDVLNSRRPLRKIGWKQ